WWVGRLRSARHHDPISNHHDSCHRTALQRFGGHQRGGESKASMNALKNQSGFTIIEIIIAIIVLTVGVLGMVTTAALVTRMIARGQRSAEASAFAARRLERERVAACAAQNNGTETLSRGSTVVATNR